MGLHKRMAASAFACFAVCFSLFSVLLHITRKLNSERLPKLILLFISFWKILCFYGTFLTGLVHSSFVADAKHYNTTHCFIKDIRAAKLLYFNTIHPPPPQTWYYHKRMIGPKVQTCILKATCITQGKLKVEALGSITDWGQVRVAGRLRINTEDEWEKAQGTQGAKQMKKNPQGCQNKSNK